MDPITRRTAMGIMAAGTVGLSGSDAQQQTGGRGVLSLAGE